MDPLARSLRWKGEVFVSLCCTQTRRTCEFRNSVLGRADGRTMRNRERDPASEEQERERERRRKLVPCLLKAFQAVSGSWPS